MHLPQCIEYLKDISSQRQHERQCVVVAMHNTALEMLELLGMHEQRYVQHSKPVMHYYVWGHSQNVLFALHLSKGICMHQTQLCV